MEPAKERQVYPSWEHTTPFHFNLRSDARNETREGQLQKCTSALLAELMQWSHRPSEMGMVYKWDLTPLRLPILNNYGLFTANANHTLFLQELKRIEH